MLHPTAWYSDLRHITQLTASKDPHAIVPLSVHDLLDLFAEIEALKSQLDQAHQAVEELQSERES